jgi:long-chain acyl-CoA synthetase
LTGALAMTDRPGTIRSGDRRLTLDELRDRARRAAGGLAAAGVTEGGMIAVMLRNDVAFVEAMLAAGYLGAYFVPISWHLKRDEVRFLLADSGATHLVIHTDLLPEVRQGIQAGVEILTVPTSPEIREAYGLPATEGGAPEGDREWESLIQGNRPWTGHPLPARRMMYSSGTTGHPKGIKRHPVAPELKAAITDLNRQWFGHRAGMSTAIIGPLYHSVQTSYLASALPLSASLILSPRFDAETVLRLIESDKLTHLHLVPTMMMRLLNLPKETRRRYDLSSLEFVIHGAAPCPPTVKRRMIEWFGPIIYEYYGTSEAGMVSRCSSEEWLRREGTVGRAWPGRTIRILDDDRNEAPAGVEGNVYMSLGILPDFAYHNDPEGRAAIGHDGLITNGDIGYLDDDGYLFLCDRKQDMVISGGTNIYPVEIEAVLATHPLVLDCAVFGVPDDEFGEVLAAVVQPRPGTTVSADELRSFLGPRLARYKIPRRFALTESMPRDDSGKLFKRILRDPYWAAANRRI